ncbi:hypothetical protein [Actinoplanes solisilvae]|uniref:hypothetical protein n=1 Tax=Actinoplanes solisilvae TaxID=2486853 RepID=UPI000FDAB48C|nr:hypothetical protein [Actinoplanes solisilvae]
MTEHSQSGMRGNGPFEEGADPAAPSGAQQPAKPGASDASPHDEQAAAWVTEDGPEPTGGPNPASGSQPNPSADPRPASDGPYHPSADPRPASDGPYHPSADPRPASDGPYHPSADPRPASDGLYHPDADPGPVNDRSYPAASSYPASDATPSYGPFHNSADQPEGWADTPYGLAAPPGRRIEPSPPPRRSRLGLGLVAGLVAGLLVFGTGGFFAGRFTAPEARSSGATQPGQPGVFERNQAAINRPDFAGSRLTAIAEGWLPYLSTCSRSGSPGGPRLGDGEKVRVRCTLDGMSAIFVEYSSTAERDKARAKVLAQADDARTLTKGVAAPTERDSPSGRTNGNYLEYAYRLTESGATRTISALWWDDAQSPVAGYLLAYWAEGLGEKWEPIRDLWSRYA